MKSQSDVLYRTQICTRDTRIFTEEIKTRGFINIVYLPYMNNV